MGFLVIGRALSLGKLATNKFPWLHLMSFPVCVHASILIAAGFVEFCFRLCHMEQAKIERKMVVVINRSEHVNLLFTFVLPNIRAMPWVW